MAFDNGYDFIYHPHGESVEQDNRKGSHAKIIRPLTNKDLDLSLYGNMYRVEFDDGFITDIPEHDILPHIDAERLLQYKEDFDDCYAAACQDVRQRLVSHFFDTDNWTTQQIEEITGKNIYAREGFEEFGEIDIPKYTNDEGDFDWNRFEEDEGYLPLEIFDSKYLDDMLMTNSDFDLQTMIQFANAFNVDLSGLEVPHKIIVLHDGPYRLLNDYPKIQSMLESEESIPLYLIDKYIVCSNKEDLLEKWKENLKDSEGSWYGVKDGDNLIIGGSYDPNDVEDIEEIPTYIIEYEMSAKISAHLDKDKMYDYGMNENIGVASKAIIGEYNAESQTFEIECNYTVRVPAYTLTGAVAKAQDSFAHADFGNLKDIELLSQFEIKGSRRYKEPDKSIKEARFLIQAVKNGTDAILRFKSIDNPLCAFVVILEKDEYLDNVYSLLLARSKTNADKEYNNDKVIGRIYDLYGEKDVAKAIKDIREETAIISSDKGRKPIKELLKLSNKHEKELI